MAWLAWRVRRGMFALASTLGAACGLSEVGDAPAEGGTAPSGTPDSAALDATAGDSSASDGAPDGSARDTEGPPDGGTGRDASPESSAPDASGDAPGDSAKPADAADGAPAVIAVVQTGNSDESNPVTVTLAPTKAQSFLAVLAAYLPGQSVQSVTDNAPGGSNHYVSANVRSMAAQQDAEIWYARDANPGATSVVVTVTTGGSFEVWVMEATGLAASGGADQGQIGSGGPTTTVVAPAVTPSATPALIVAAVCSNQTLGSVVSGNPFVGLAVQNGNGAAYYVPTTPGAYGPVYHNSFAAWNASVAAFR
jgi:hypothetical protein